MPHNQWTLVEISTLRAALAEGIPTKTISKLMGYSRSDRSISQKMYYLRLTHGQIPRNPKVQITIYFDKPQLDSLSLAVHKTGKHRAQFIRDAVMEKVRSME